MSDQVNYEYLSEAEAERRAVLYRKEIDPSAVALGVGKKGWVVAIRPGWRLCDTCGGTGWVDDHECPRGHSCVNGWVRVESRP